ncbi:hypothetical protein CIRMBP1270_02420 [Enterococcus cecorum]|nr:hypothetical protein CIRMBP1282_02267 [Enterococcus cecorum]CAI3477941.1 hypothetical protein CIRMBP1270_02420 [Enterococcus cecorum]CAI3479214.1 hypothetical protein CIRMBP1263_02291 [Enterococcus cecorum]CAI3488420.1 hypothetical protein CIRMBP1276_02457 [Enterococcus cecorum]CAI3489227.1 hypothetical protein CIRMBP1237_02383 [Enterococcus cecorum]
MHCHMSFDINFIILKFSRIRCDFLMGYVRIKASANSVGCNGTNPALIGTIFPTFACVGCHLQAKFLNYSLNLLFVDEISLIMKLSMYSTISVILIILTDFLDFFFKFFVRIFSIKSFLPIHICCFRHACIREKVF